MDALFGPVRFRNGETGIVSREVDSIDLTSEPDGDEVVGTCQQDERIRITDTSVVRIDDELFYELECSRGMGWSSQDFLVGPVKFDAGERVLVTVPGVQNSAAAQAAVSEASTEENESAGEPEASTLASGTPESIETVPEEVSPVEVVIPVLIFTS